MLQPASAATFSSVVASLHRATMGNASGSLSWKFKLIYIYKASKLEVQEEYAIFFKLQVKFGDFIV